MTKTKTKLKKAEEINTGVLITVVIVLSVLKALNFLCLILSLKIGEICTKEVQGSPTHHWMKESQGVGRSELRVNFNISLLQNISQRPASSP